MLCVFGVGFQLYNQLKESPHDGMRVLGSSAILTASQTTRLGRNSTWHEINTCLRDPIVRSTSSEFIKTLLLIFFSYSSVLSFIPLFLSSLCDLIISPVPTCLVHNCEISRRSSFTFICYHSCFMINPLWSPSAILDRQNSETERFRFQKYHYYNGTLVKFLFNLTFFFKFEFISLWIYMRDIILKHKVS